LHAEIDYTHARKSEIAGLKVRFPLRRFVPCRFVPFRSVDLVSGKI